jgi:predicted RNase H-like nuclease (RuvC/YqgF family)
MEVGQAVRSSIKQFHRTLKHKQQMKTKLSPALQLEAMLIGKTKTHRTGNKMEMLNQKIKELELKLESANERIKRLVQAGDCLLSHRNSTDYHEKVREWDKAKKDKP